MKDLSQYLFNTNGNSMHSKDSKFVIVRITYFLKMRMVKKLVVSILDNFFI